jgi:hypothetical protein
MGELGEKTVQPNLLCPECSDMTREFRLVSKTPNGAGGMQYIYRCASTGCKGEKEVHRPE